MLKILITGGNGNIAKIIKRNLSSETYEITNLSRNDLNVLNLQDIKNYLTINKFDILVHTAILGGRRTKEETGEVTHLNLLMLENLLTFAYRFKMIINFDSAAIYDRSTDILNRKERDLFTIPTDYYGFSKYVIYKRSLQYLNMYNFRIFNIFHANEEPDRFIKKCFLAKETNSVIDIFEDKYFDFVYEDDFIKIIKFYFDNTYTQSNLKKTINICYEQKYKLSDIAKHILTNKTNINIISNSNDKNYSGDFSTLKTLNLNFLGLEDSLKMYENKLENIKDEELKNIFIDNKIDYTKVKFIVFSIPKSGSESIYQSLKHKYNIQEYEILKFHSIVELKAIDSRFGKYTVLQIVMFIEKYSIHTKIYIFSSYRTPCERFVSFFYHNNKVYNLNRNLNQYVDLNHLLSATNNPNSSEYTAYQDVFVDLYEKQFNINLDKYYYNTLKGYCKINYTNKISWIFTNLKDLNKCFRNLKYTDDIFDNLTIQIKNVNTTNEYLNLKTKITFNKDCLKYFYSKEKKAINFYKLYFPIQT